LIIPQFQIHIPAPVWSASYIVLLYFYG
jgi:hypothetical protein